MALTTVKGKREPREESYETEKKNVIMTLMRRVVTNKQADSYFQILVSQVRSDVICFWKPYWKEI